MARIRTIKPEFFTSDQVVECSPTARLLFIGLWCFCDDGGIHPATPKRIKMEIFPGDQFSDETINGLVDELVCVGLLARFDAEGKSWLAVTGWHHQKIEKPSYRYPRRPFDDQSPTDRRPFDDSSPPEGSLRESKGRESKGERGGRCVAASPPSVFEIAAYCVERNNTVDPELFHAHYTANGWKQSNGQLLKDWKAAIVTWEKRRSDPVGVRRTAPPAAQPQTAAERRMKDAE